MTKRYTIKNGKYGAYFYDNRGGEDMTLEDVENHLNKTREKCQNLLAAQAQSYERKLSLWLHNGTGGGASKFISNLREDFKKDIEQAKDERFAWDNW